MGYTTGEITERRESDKEKNVQIENRNCNLKMEIKNKINIYRNNAGER